MCMCVCTRVHMYMHALVVCVGHVSLCVLHVLHTFSVCVHVLGWVNMSPPTHQLSMLTSCMPSCARAACVSVAVEHSVTCTKVE